MNRNCGLEGRRKGRVTVDDDAAAETARSGVIITLDELLR